jgi:hypothetical protein
VLPAFGDFTGNGIIDPVEDDRVFAVADGAVLAIPIEHAPVREAASAHTAAEER